MEKMTLMGMLRYLNELGEEMFPMDRKSVWKNLYGYYPSEIKRNAAKLEEKGWVKKQLSEKGLKVEITEQGRKQVLLYLLDQMEPKTGKWDGKWRIVFFDVSNRYRRKRDKLRDMLKNMGFYELQESVYVNPYDYTQEIGYIKEALGLDEGIRLGLLEEIEDEEELRQVFGVSR